MSKNIRNMSKEELINEYQKMSDLILQQSQKLNTLTETILLKDQTIVDLKTKTSDFVSEPRKRDAEPTIEKYGFIWMQRHVAAVWLHKPRF